MNQNAPNNPRRAASSPARHPRQPVWLAVLALLAACSPPAPGTAPRITQPMALAHPPTRVKGTRVFLVPPVGYEQSETRDGLDGPAGQYIIVNDTQASFDQISALYDADGYKQFTFVEDQRRAFGPHQSRWIDLQFSAYLGTYVLVFGDTSFAAIVTASYNPADPATRAAARAAALSATYDPAATIEPLEKSPFRLDTRQSRLQLQLDSAESSTRVGVYTLPPAALGSESAARPPFGLLVVTSSPAGSAAAPAQLAQQHLATALQMNEWSTLTTTPPRTAPVNGYEACEIEAHGIAGGAPLALYVLVVSNGKFTATLSGTARYDEVTTLAVIKNLAHTIVLRQTINGPAAE